MKHTPGPWKVKDGVIYCADGIPPFDATHTRIDGKGEWEANVHLIAAAPELLAACKALVDNLIWASGSSDFAPDGIAREGWLKVGPSISQGMAAIAKAEGEA